MSKPNTSSARARHRAAAALLPLWLTAGGVLAQSAPTAPAPPAASPAPAAAPAPTAPTAPIAPTYQGPAFERFLRQNPDFAAALGARRLDEAKALLDRSGDPRAGLAQIYLLLERDRLSDAWQAARTFEGADRAEALRAVTRHALRQLQGPGLDAKKRAQVVELGYTAATLAVQAEPDSIESTTDKSLLLREMAAQAGQEQAKVLRGEADRFAARAAELQKAKPAKGRTEPLRVEGAVKKPEKIAGDAPVATDVALEAGVWGDVTVDAVIDEQGNVVDAQIVKGLPMGLDQQALAAVRTWKFKPATLEGKPVKVRTDVKVTFEKPAKP
jgi:TonB family protein